MQIDFRPDEEWLELPQDPQYLISTHGRLYDTVRRRLVSVSDTRSFPVLAWSIRERRQGASSNNRYIRAARAVLSTFEGPRPDQDPDYVDGNPANLRLDNLVWAPKRVRTPAR